jgi:hypothetical protein
LQRIAQQLEYRLIRRRLENGASAWAQWLEEDQGRHPSGVCGEEGYPDDSDNSPDDPPASQHSILQGSSALRLIDASDVECSLSPGGAAESPADELKEDEVDLDTGDDHKGTSRSEDAQVTLPTPACSSSSTQNFKIHPKKKSIFSFPFSNQSLVQKPLAIAPTRSA